MKKKTKHNALFYIFALYDAGYSQEFLADLCEVHKNSIIRWLIHKFKPSLAVDRMICQNIGPIYHQLLKDAPDNGTNNPKKSPVTKKMRFSKKNRLKDRPQNRRRK